MPPTPKLHTDPPAAPPPGPPPPPPPPPDPGGTRAADTPPVADQGPLDLNSEPSIEPYADESTAPGGVDMKDWVPEQPADSSEYMPATAEEYDQPAQYAKESPPEKKQMWAEIARQQAAAPPAGADG